MLKKNRLIFLVVVMIFTFTGCSTHKAFVPTIQETQRTGLTLERPVAIAFHDGRLDKSKSFDIESSFRQGLEAAYGNSIQWINYYDKAENNNVTIRIRVKKLGADFGSRVVSTTTVASLFSQAQVNATSSWGHIVANASSNQQLLGASFSGEGWWIGTAWLELDIEDKRNARPITFTLPMISEHRESNMWGYRSAKQATKRAWSTVMPNLMHTLDMALMKIRDDY